MFIKQPQRKSIKKHKLIQNQTRIIPLEGLVWKWTSVNH